MTTLLAVLLTMFGFGGLALAATIAIYSARRFAELYEEVRMARAAAELARTAAERAAGYASALRTAPTNVVPLVPRQRPRLTPGGPHVGQHRAA